MIHKIFVDTDVILDVALAREPFCEYSKIVLSIIENSLVVGTVSSNCVANIYYILRKTGGDIKARKFIRTILSYISVITINHQNVLQALGSKFTDFEDALQHYSAVENQCNFIITKNIDDYKYSAIEVCQPKEFIKLFE